MNFSDVEVWVYGALLAWLVGATALTLFATIVGRRQTGRAILVKRHGGRARVVLGALLVAAGGVAVTTDGLPLGFALPALLLGLFIALVAPSSEDAVYGENGVRRGWHARRFDQLEGWRLTGEHLRFLVHGELVAVPIPDAEVAGLRARLEELVPDSQSEFQA